METESPKQIKTIAREFAKLMLAEIGAENLASAVAENMADMAQGNDSTCATHNFCDANMVMDEAFHNVLGRGMYLIDEDATEAQKDSDTELWNSAWTMAKHAGFNVEKI